MFTSYWVYIVGIVLGVSAVPTVLLVDALNDVSVVSNLSVVKLFNQVTQLLIVTPVVVLLKSKV
jgi:hypothetical protein